MSATENRQFRVSVTNGVDDIFVAWIWSDTHCGAWWATSGLVKDIKGKLVNPESYYTTVKEFSETSGVSFHTTAQGNTKVSSPPTASAGATSKTERTRATEYKYVRSIDPPSPVSKTAVRLLPN